MESTWIIKKHFKRKPKLEKPVLIEGLPGIGNVGKVAVDFLIDELNAKRLYTFNSYTFPHSVFINEDNLVELPSIALYAVPKHNLLLLAGDIQPTDEFSCYKFTEIILDIFDEFKGDEIITTGGIGLMDIPEDPKVFATANCQEIIKRYKKFGKINEQIYGVVGPIIGVTGLLVGMSEDWDKQAISLLAETFGHPMFLGIKGAREILKILIKRFNIKIDLKQLEKEIQKIEKEMIKRKEELTNITKQSAMQKYKGKIGDEEVNYIG